MQEEIAYLKKYLPKERDYEEALNRLYKGEPVQYIVGDVNFYGNTMLVNKNVLIPRRETEELVEKTSNYIRKLFSSNINILDIGTGSGCISITLKKFFKESTIEAVDISERALEVARENAKINNVEILFKKSDIFSNVTNVYDVIISNPPYIGVNEEIMDIVKNNEPSIALYAEEDGLYFYRKILQEAQPYLKDKFLIAFEIGEEQGEKIINLAQTYFPIATVCLEKDMQHLNRFIFIINE